MKALTLTLRAPPPGRVDLSALIPDRLQGLRRSDIAAIALRSGERKLAVAELFELGGEDTAHIQLRGDLARFDAIGAGMRAGSITVYGDVGRRVGAGMGGGRLVVHGDCGDWLGAGMEGGEIEVHGDAADFVGAALPGEPHGMSHGSILVTGSAGAFLGERMRRGTLLVKGNAGDYCGARMLAGTIVVLGTVGEFAGLGMRRGSIILLRRPKRIPATFNSCGVLEMQFLRLLRQCLRRSHTGRFDLAAGSALAERYCGDLGTGGKGELIILRSAYPSRRRQLAPTASTR